MKNTKDIESRWAKKLAKHDKITDPKQKAKSREDLVEWLFEATKQ